LTKKKKTTNNKQQQKPNKQTKTKHAFPKTPLSFVKKVCAHLDLWRQSPLLLFPPPTLSFLPLSHQKNVGF